MGYKIDEIEGIGPAYKSKLAEAKIQSTDDLLKTCCKPQGRKELSAQTGVGESQLLKWANMADLMRVSGVGAEFAELLEGSGVDTIKELRQRNADNLALQMKKVNETKKLTRAVPTASMVQGWIDQAKKIEPLIEH